MIFAKIDVTLAEHHRVLQIPVGIRAEAMGVWMLALLWTRGHERDGFCPIEALHKVAREKIIAKLEAVGLVTREVDEYGVHGIRVLRYEAHNETKAQIDKRKEIDRRRKGSVTPRGVQRDSVRNPLESTDGFPGSGSGSGSDSVSEEREPRMVSLPRGVVSLERAAWIASYEQAVSAVTGARFMFPAEAFETLRAVVEAHCLGEARKDMGSWIERDVGLFVASVKEQREYYSAFSPKGLLRWHNLGCPGKPAPSVKRTAHPLQSETRRGPATGAELMAIDRTLASLKAAE